MQTPGLQEAAQTAVESSNFTGILIGFGIALVMLIVKSGMDGRRDRNRLETEAKIRRDDEDRALLREADTKKAEQEQLRAKQHLDRLLKFQGVTKERIREDGAVMRAGGGENVFDEDWQKALEEIRQVERDTKLIAELNELLQKRETLNLVHPLLPWLEKRIREAQGLDPVED